jgi:diacylglycerol kinase family enzyme
MRNKAVLVFNENSGKDQVALHELVERIQMNLQGFELEVFEIQGEKAQVRLAGFLGKTKPNLIIIAGGDGTIKLTANTVKFRVPLAVLPLGSANGFAKCLGISNLEDGFEALRKLEVGQVDAIQIGDELCLHLADFGFNASMIQKFEEGNTRGMLGYIKSSISEVFNSESCRFRIEMKAETIELAAKMLVIANGEEYGTGATINTEGMMDDGKFEIVAVEFKSTGDLISITKGLVTGENQAKSAVKTWSTEACKIYNLDRANFQIDGELRGNPLEVDVKILKGAFDFVKKN